GQDPERIAAAVREVVAQSPDVVFATTNPVVAAAAKSTRTVPIVFSSVSDSVGSGFVASLGRPGGNVTGFHNFESDIAGKWLEILKQVAPGVRRAAFLHDPAIAAHVAFVRVASAVAPSLTMTVVAAEAHDTGDIERVLGSFGKEPAGGIIVA